LVAGWAVLFCPPILLIKAVRSRVLLYTSE
jgi:hypothetical protein